MQADPPHEEGREEKIRILWPSIRNAYLAFEFAVSKAGRILTDREAHDILKEEGVRRNGSGELIDYDLPCYATFTSYCTKARIELGEQKHTKRRGRSHHNSIVRPGEI